jgi:hypothetical protein
MVDLPSFRPTRPHLNMATRKHSSALREQQLLGGEGSIESWHRVKELHERPRRNLRCPPPSQVHQRTSPVGEEKDHVIRSTRPSNCLGRNLAKRMAQSNLGQQFLVQSESLLFRLAHRHAGPTKGRRIQDLRPCGHPDSIRFCRIGHAWPGSILPPRPPFASRAGRHFARHGIRTSHAAPATSGGTSR